MRKDEWAEAMEQEAASVEDIHWAQQTRRVAWGLRRRAELRAALAWRPLSRLLLVLALPPLGVLLVASLSRLPDPVTGEAVRVLNTGAGMLLLLVWLARYVWLGYAPWALAAVASLLPFTLWFGLRMANAWELLLSSLLTFALLWGFGWALSRLKSEGEEEAV